MLRCREIGYNAVSHRSDNSQRIGVFANHIPCAFADGNKLSAFFFVSGNARLGHNNALSLNKNHY